MNKELLIQKWEDFANKHSLHFECGLLDPNFL
jgi:hypothetical protein